VTRKDVVRVLDSYATLLMLLLANFLLLELVDAVRSVAEPRKAGDLSSTRCTRPGYRTARGRCGPRNSSGPT
jgi:hypothetical protein